jgi:hypothetical protein
MIFEVSPEKSTDYIPTPLLNVIVIGLIALERLICSYPQETKGTEYTLLLL